MNQLMLAVVVLVLFVYFGGSRVPSVLRQNKEMLLGVVVGLFLGSIFGFRMEGYNGDDVLPSEGSVQQKRMFSGKSHNLPVLKTLPTLGGGK